MEQRKAMAGLSDFEKMLPALSRGEKAQILKWVVRELDDDFPGVDSRPDVCGSGPCIVRTRLAFPVANGRILLIHNRGHFLRLHQHRTAGHTGIVLCTFDPDFCRQA